MLKWIFAAVFLAIVWVASILFELPLWIPIVLTVLTVLALGTVFLVRRLRARRAARELEKALAAQAAEQARTARPDLQAEIMQMQQEFQRAVQALKSSRLGKGGKDALYELPWYVIIGPPGSGKSTALRNSGLQFPYLSSQKSGAVRGIGGTRNCDWWLTNEAVLLDTAGRWTTEDEDRDEWHGFLDLTKRFRARKPLNGILVAVSVDEIGGAHEEEVAALAKQIRERIDEVMGRLQMSLPVYLLWTKSDLIPGFVETFGDLDKRERGQIWGFTAPLATPIGEPGNYFAQRFDELSTILERNALRRMSEERRIDTRERIHEFPQQFVVLRKNLSDFVSQLFAENVFQETPQFRGAYFTSGTQEGRPIDRLMSRMAEAFGIQGRMPVAEPVVDPKSYFLTDVFQNVVFKDKDIAVRSQAEVRRQKMRQYVTAAAIFFLALLISVLPAYAWFNSQEYLDETARIAAAASTTDAEGGIDVAQLGALRDRTAQLRAYEADGPPVSMSLGMYEGDDVYPHIRDLYVELVREKLVSPIVTADLEQLDEFGRRYEAFDTARPTPEEHAGQYDMLKSHLLMSKEREAREPGLTEPMQQWVSQHVARRWAERNEVEGDDPRVQSVREHAGFYAALQSDDEELLYPRDTETVQRVRNALSRVSTEALALDQIIAEMSRLGYDLNLTRLVGTTSALRSRQNALVRGAFTRRAWDTRIRDVMSEPPEQFLGEPWVLGRDVTPDEDAEEQLNALRTEYFRRYVAEWREFLDKVRGSAAGNHEDALGLMQELTRGDPTPLESLFEQVDYNTTLPVPADPSEEAGESEGAAALVNAARRAVTKRTGRVGAAALRDLEGRMARGGEGIPTSDPRYVEQEFDGFTRFGVAPPSAEGQPPQTVSLDVYLSELRTVRDALQTYVDDPASSNELMGKLQTARTTVRGLIEQQPVEWRPNFEAILWPPIDSAAMNSSKAMAMTAGRSWCNEVAVPFDQSMLGKYPFNPQGHDVPISDFQAFFQPGQGIVWSFYDEALKNDIIMQGNSFSFARRLGRDTDSMYQRSLVQFLERAHGVTSAFFPPGSSDPKTEFDVRIRPTPTVANTELTVDGTMVSYENAPERWTRVRWPGDAPERGASIRVIGENGMHETVQQEGEWGLFRLLEAGTVVARGGNVFTITWRLQNGVQISMDFRPARDVSPFYTRGGNQLMGPVRTGIDAPEEIVVGQRTCPSRGR